MVYVKALDKDRRLRVSNWGWDSMEGLPEADSEALMRQLTNEHAVQVSVTLDDIAELRMKAMKQNKGRGKGKTKKMRRYGYGELGEDRLLDRGGYSATSLEHQMNETIEVVVRVPKLMMTAVEGEVGSGDKVDGFVREAIRDALVKRGVTWWFPRFLMSSQADEELAKRQFTSKFE